MAGSAGAKRQAEVEANDRGFDCVLLEDGSAARELLHTSTVESVELLELRGEDLGSGDMKGRLAWFSHI